MDVISQNTYFFERNLRLLKKRRHASVKGRPRVGRGSQFLIVLACSRREATTARELTVEILVSIEIERYFRMVRRRK